MNIVILDNALAFKGIIDNWESFFTVLVHGDVCSAHIQIDNNKNNVDLLTKGAFFYASDDPEHVFCVTEDPSKQDKEGDIKKIIGFDVLWILQGRLSNVDANPVTYTAKSVEHIIKDRIDKMVVNPTDSARAISTIAIAPNQDRGSVINSTFYQTQLDIDIIKLLAIDGLGIKGSYDNISKKIMVDMYEGADRSEGNPDGNAPVIFDVKYDNVISSEEKNSITHVKNFAYTLGVDTDGKRKIEQCGTDTGMNRREIAVDGGDISDSSELQTIGKSALSVAEKMITVSADAIRGSFVYNRDYFLGDICTIAGNKLRLVKVEIVYEAGKADQVYLTFGATETTIESKTLKNTARISALETKLTVIKNNTLNDPLTVYVSPTGSDITGNGTSANPWRTIQYAIDQSPDTLNANYIVQLAAGTYTEKNINIYNKLGSGDILIYGDGANSTAYIIQGELTSSTDYIIKAQGCIARPFIRGVQLLNTGLRQGWGVRLDRCMYPLVYQCTITNFGNGITRGAVDVNACEYVTVYACDFSNNALAIRATSGSKINSQSNLGNPVYVAYASYMGWIHRNGDVMTGATGESAGGQVT